MAAAACRVLEVVGAYCICPASTSRATRYSSARPAAVAVGDDGQHDQKVRDVAGGDEPFLAVDDVAAVVRDGSGLNGRRIGAGARFGDGEGVAALTADAGDEVLLALRRGAVDEHVG